MAERRHGRSSFLLLLGLLISGPAAADRILLQNGNAFDGVLTEVTEREVSIRLPYGQMRLPRSMVREIERSRTPLEEFFERHDRLARGEETRAEEWLELSHWARRAGLDHNATQAAKMAAAMEPRLEGLGSVMRGLGYVLDEEIERWLPYEEYMQRRGMVYDGGEWISRFELAARERAREEEREQQREAVQGERLAQVVELLALSQIERLTAAREPTASSFVPWFGYPVAIFPGGWVDSGPGHGRHRLPHRRVSPSHPPVRLPHTSHLEQVLLHQPGSIVKIPPPVHRGRLILQR